jgi:hypothetical protein
MLSCKSMFGIMVGTANHGDSPWFFKSYRVLFL